MATIRRAGYELDDDNDNLVFRVVIEYPAGDPLPDFPIEYVWNRTPVDVEIKPLETPTA